MPVKSPIPGLCGVGPPRKPPSLAKFGEVERAGQHHASAGSAGGGPDFRGSFATGVTRGPVGRVASGPGGGAGPGLRAALWAARHLVDSLALIIGTSPRPELIITKEPPLWSIRA